MTKRQNTKGKRSSHRNYILGFDIGGTKMAVLLGNENGDILHRRSTPSRAARGPHGMITELIQLGHQVLQDQSVASSSLQGLGISCGGPLDSQKGIVYSPPNLPGWIRTPIVKQLQQAFHVPAFLENDANATALAEYYWGGGKGKQNLIYLTMGTGIGGGIIINGKLYSGTNDMAGEIGHTIVLPGGPPCNCGKFGCLEAISSGTGIANRACEGMPAFPNSLVYIQAQGNSKNVTSELVCEAARKQDPFAVDIIANAAYFLGVALSNVIHILNPEVIIIGTLFYKAKDLFVEPVRTCVKQHTWSRMNNVCKIIPSPLREKGQDLAALAIVRYRMNQKT